MNKPKLLFVYDHKYPEYWMDGLWAALRLLEEDFTLTMINLQDTDVEWDVWQKDWDFILGWGAFGSPVDQEMQKIKNKKGLCIAGNATLPTGADNYDVLFYETKWYRPQINFHKNIVHAFGVNTDIFFKPNITMPIIWDYIGVGAFASWKRWDKMLQKKGNRLVVGEVQEDNQSESLDLVARLING